MCGIFCTISRGQVVEPSQSARNLLRQRGPDILDSFNHIIPLPDKSETVCIHFTSSVLALRGETAVAQPLKDASNGSVLCWNGEAWKTEDGVVNGNDGMLIMGLLSKASRQPDSQSSILRVIEQIRGPFAMVFYDGSGRLYYGRDCLGRRSLMKGTLEDGTTIISSVADLSLNVQWSEVDADGIYVLNVLKRAGDGASHDFISTRIPSVISGTDSIPSDPFLTLPFTDMNREVSNFPAARINVHSQAVTEIGTLLTQSLELRTLNIHQKPDMTSNERKVNVAILFSGGLDCTLLARLTHHTLHPDQEIDLLNVAFENPRIHKLGGDISFYETCPDRVTARSSLIELQQTCLGRTFRLVCVNIPFTLFQAHRQKVIDLIHPHNTEMDLSIAIALYFASRGVGTTGDEVKDFTQPEYTTPARVLLTGLGADELFGGYRRHENAFTAHGLTGEGGLLEELAEDIDRIGKRNLGRDDRVISHWGKEARYPFLDEDVVAWALKAPVWDKVGFGFKLGDEADGGDLEPGKLVLRLLAKKLGMSGVAKEKKRAIQFGARTAKMGVGSGKTKGTHQLS